MLADLAKIADLLQFLHFWGRAHGEAKLLMRVMQTCGTCVDFVLFVRWSRSQWVSAKHSKPYASFRIREAKKSPYGKNKFGGWWHGDCNVVCRHRSLSGSVDFFTPSSSEGRKVAPKASWFDGKQVIHCGTLERSQDIASRAVVKRHRAALLRSKAGGSSEGRHDRIDCEYGKPQQIEATVHVVKASHPVAVYRTAVIEDEGNG